jgi:broad specificity phosphatase PhoE
MINVLLIRHATHDAIGRRILGRTPGVHLNDAGIRQAEQLAETLSVLPIDTVFSGPLERARETARPLARRLNMNLQVAGEFDELAMGEWTNRTLAELNMNSEWRKWNTKRSETTPPNGESMHQVKTRTLARIAALGNEFRCIAIFTHADVIRAALTHFLGTDLDLLFRFQIDPASVSIVQIHADCAVVRTLNWVPFGTALN